MPRQQVYSSNAERQRAYRERQKGKAKAQARARAFAPSPESVELLETLWQQNAQAEAIPTSRGHVAWEEQTATLRRLALSLNLSLPTLPSKYGTSWVSRGHAPTIPGTHEDSNLPTF